MDPTAEALLESFANAANWTTLQKEDWRRFYAFVIHVHASNLRVSPDTVRRRLLLHGFPGEVSDQVSGLFASFVELLAEYDRHEEGPTHACGPMGASGPAHQPGPSHPDR